MKGFKNFIMQGNVIDLAVGVVIGSAFTALINAFVSNLIEPIINVFGGSNVNGLSFTITNDATRVDLGALISAIISFLITAAVVYFVFVMPMQQARAMARKQRGLPPEEDDPIPADVELLTEIRDLLRSQQPQGTVPPAGTVGQKLQDPHGQPNGPIA